MARAFGNAYTNYLSRSGSLISASDPRPITVSVWLYANANGTTHAIFVNNFGSADPTLYCAVRAGSPDVMSLYANSNYVDSSNFTLATSAWTHLAWTWNTDNAVEFFHNGSSIGTASRAAAGGTDNAASIGTLNGSISGFDIDGSLAEFAVYNAILASGQITALADRVSPLLIRPDVLVAYLPIMGRTSPENDLMSGTTWTVTGTLNQSAHPPMMYPGQAQVRGLAGAVVASENNHRVPGGGWGGRVISYPIGLAA